MPYIPSENNIPQERIRKPILVFAGGLIGALIYNLMRVRSLFFPSFACIVIGLVFFHSVIIAEAGFN